MIISISLLLFFRRTLVLLLLLLLYEYYCCTFLYRHNRVFLILFSPLVTHSWLSDAYSLRAPYSCNVLYVLHELATASAGHVLLLCSRNAFPVIEFDTISRKLGKNIFLYTSYHKHNLRLRTLYVVKIK